MNNKYCPKCASINDANAVFCNQCGTSLQESIDNIETIEDFHQVHNQSNKIWIILLIFGILLVTFATVIMIAFKFGIFN